MKIWVNGFTRNGEDILRHIESMLSNPAVYRKMVSSIARFHFHIMGTSMTIHAGPILIEKALNLLVMSSLS